MAKKSHMDRGVVIFENPWLEKLTKVHPVGPFLFWTPIILGLFYISSTYFTLNLIEYISCVLGGLFVWTFVEYALHRWVFHLESKNPDVARWIYVIHGNHHDDPYDWYRGVMPIAPAVIYSGLLFLLFTLVLGVKYSIPFFGSFMLGYLLYDYIHFGTHHFTPRTWLGRKLRQYHLKHHVHDDKIFGVSSPLWDIVLGTFKTNKKHS